MIVKKLKMQPSKADIVAAGPIPDTDADSLAPVQT